MGGMVAQLVYRRHASLLSGLVLCSTAGNVGSPAQELAAFALPAVAAGLAVEPGAAAGQRRGPGSALLGPIEDPAAASWARAQLGRTTLVSAVSAIQAVCQFSSDGWISQVDIPTAVVVTTRDRIVPMARNWGLARAIPGASVHEVDADHAVCITAPQVFARTAAEACWSVESGRGRDDPRFGAA